MTGSCNNSMAALTSRRDNVLATSSKRLPGGSTIFSSWCSPGHWTGSCSDLLTFCEGSPSLCITYWFPWSRLLFKAEEPFQHQIKSYKCHNILPYPYIITNSVKRSKKFYPQTNHTSLEILNFFWEAVDSAIRGLEISTPLLSNNSRTEL